MGQKRVTFDVAKALKDVGYPQKHSEFGYSTKEQTLDGFVFKEGSIIDLDAFEPMFDDFVYAPHVMEAWLWLWRENIARIVICADTCYIWYNENDYETMTSRTRDPEEAIEAAIKYIVDNGLLK